MKRTKKIILEYEAITKKESEALKKINKLLTGMVFDYESSMDYLKTRALTTEEAIIFTKKLTTLLKEKAND